MHIKSAGRENDLGRRGGASLLGHADNVNNPYHFSNWKFNATAVSGFTHPLRGPCATSKVNNKYKRLRRGEERLE